MIDQYLVTIRVDVEREDDRPMSEELVQENIEKGLSRCSSYATETEVIEVNHIDTLIDGVPVGKQD